MKFSFLYNPLDLLAGPFWKQLETLAENKFVLRRKADEFVFFIRKCKMVSAVVSPDNIAGSVHARFTSIPAKTIEASFSVTGLDFPAR